MIPRKHNGCRFKSDTGCLKVCYCTSTDRLTEAGGTQVQRDMKQSSAWSLQQDYNRDPIQDEVCCTVQLHTPRSKWCGHSFHGNRRCFIRSPFTKREAICNLQVWAYYPSHFPLPSHYSESRRPLTDALRLVLENNLLTLIVATCSATNYTGHFLNHTQMHTYVRARPR